MNIPACAACHKPIHGRHYQALGGYWHPDCFLCPECRQPIGGGQFVEKKGYPFHPRCYASKHAPLCPGCETPITGAGITALGRSWHVQCLLCAGCRQPIRDSGFLQHDQKPYHVACYHKQFSPHCVICDGPVQSLNHVTNGWGETFCQEHLRQYASCASCNRLLAPRLTGGGVRYRDGRNLCQHCRSTAVDNEFQGSKVLREVRDFLHAMGMPFPDHPIPLRLAGVDELSRIARTATSRPPLGVTRTSILTRGQQVVDRVLQEIVILYGLPREHFAMVAAHELGHAWLFLQECGELPGEVEEGVCTLCEYFWLKNLDDPTAAYRLKGLEEERDPVYGKGFQSARQSLQRLSFPELLAFVQKHRRWPLNNPFARLLRVI